LVKQIGLFKLSVDELYPAWVRIEINKDNALLFNADHLIDLQRCVEDARGIISKRDNE